MVKRVKITIIFVNITTNQKAKKKWPDWDKNVLILFSLQHIQLLISLSPSFTISLLLLHLQNDSSYFLFFYFIIFIWCTKRKGHLLFRFIYRRSLHLSSSSSISLSFFDVQNENLLFPSKTLENFSSILSSSVSFRILGKFVILFFSSYLIFYLQAQRKQWVHWRVIREKDFKKWRKSKNGNCEQKKKVKYKKMKQMNVKLLSKNPNYQQKGQVILLNRWV